MQLRPFIKLELSLSPSEVPMGGELELNLTLQSTGDEAQKLVVDFVMHFVKANGKTSPKVFKLTTRTLDARGETTMAKKISLRPVSTRRYYPGEHHVAVQVNGKVLGQGSFLLV